MKLSAENYFSPENELKYMGHTQFVNFLECEARALALIRGEWSEEPTTSMLVGSYVDAYFEGTLDKFKETHLTLFTQKGELKSEFRQAEKIIARIERDEMFSRYMSGQKQVIKTGEICGVPFKIKIDSYHRTKALVDLKIIKDFQPVWKNGEKQPFAQAWGYDIEAAIYQTIEGNKLPFFLATATKEKPEPDIAIISIPQERIDECMTSVYVLAPYYNDLKHGVGTPKRCGRCAYCRATKKLTEIVDYREI